MSTHIPVTPGKRVVRIPNRLILLAALLLVIPLSPETTLPADKNKPQVVVFIPGEQRYVELAGELKNAVQQKGYDCNLVELSDSVESEQGEKTADSIDLGDPDLIISLGAQLTILALKTEPETPVLFFMVPNALDSPLIDSNAPISKNLAGVAYEAAPLEKVRWIAQVYPENKRIAVLHSNRTRKTAQSIESAAAGEKITILPISTDKDHFLDAITEMNQARVDGVIMIPDAKVYNAATVKRLLLWGIRNEKSVWAFSDKIVKAGALAGQYPDLSGYIDQTADVAQKILDGHSPQKIGMQYAKKVNYAINDRTAEMINVKIANEVAKNATVRYGE